MRAIDADALMDNIKRDSKKAIDEGDKVGSFWLGYAAGSVIAQPTIQPEPQVTFYDEDHVWIDGKQYISLRRFQEAVKEAQPKEGHWIEGNIYRDVIECNCSECGQLMTTAATVRMNYCPKCGTKMTISTK